MMSTDGDPPMAVSSDQFAQLMAAIQASQERFDNKFAEFRAEVRQGQEDAAAKAVKKVRHEKPYSFKRKGNEEQAGFNEKVEDAIAEAQIHLSGDGSAPVIERAQEALAKGMKLLAERQKLIKIADRSEYGWGVVAEYTADELADDSDDEKRLEKAEKAAERKAAKRKRKRAEPSVKTGKGRYSTLQPATSGPAPVAAAGTTYPPKRSQLLPAPMRAAGPCFACGEMGHLRSYCPKTASAETRKWYPLCLNALGAGEYLDHSRSSEWEIPGDTEFVVPNILGGTEHESVARCWEAEATEPHTQLDPISVKGRLKKCLQFWESELEAPASVLSTIESGYVLPLKSEPTPFSKQNQASARLNAQFVHQSVTDLLAGGCIKEVPEQPYICSPLSVVEGSGKKKRLVINLRHLNKFLWKQRFKYEDLRVAMLLFEQGDYLFSFDLKSGYHHVDIADHHCKYLGFAWDGHFYVLTVLPFGLATACYMFTKLLRPLVRYWRAGGLRILVYLDDGLCAVAGKVEAIEASQFVCSTLAKAGFLDHPVKSIWDPVQRLPWLGFVIDLALGQVEVPQEKLVALQHRLDQACQLALISAKQLASIVGKIISMGLAIGPVSRFMTRSLYAALESRQTWCDLLRLSPEARAELRFWSASLSEYSSQPIWRSPSALRVVYSDASETGYGGYVVEHGPCVSFGQWTAEEASQSSTWRELSAVYQVLLAVACKLANTRVRWFTDNQNVARILQVGSKKPQLHAIALKVFALSVQYQLHLEPEWIPKDLNVRADFLSRIVDHDDWFLDPAIFARIDAMWGPHTVDRFASFHNAQLPRFNSRCWNPGSEAVDAFTVNWGGQNNWWCPPIGLIPRVIRHAQVCAAVGTLVVPCWPSAPFWPLLCPGNGQFAPFVIDFWDLPQVESLFLPGLSGSVLFNGCKPNTRVLALRCDFSCPMAVGTSTQV